MWRSLVPLLMVVCCGCVPATTEVESIEVVSIDDIIARSAYYQGRTVTVSGEYRGWEAGYGPPPVTRSDWVIKNETGAIYVTGKLPGLDPVEDKGRMIQVTGIVRVKDGQVYIEVK